MATLTYAEIQEQFQDALVANVSTDVPVAEATEQLRAINAAYAQVWEISGGSIKTVASATAWTSAESATGKVTGILADINEILHCWASGTSGSVGVTAGDSELDRVEMSHVLWLRQSNLTGTYARPKVYAVQRLATATAADVNKLELHYWPSVTGFYLPISYVPMFTPMDGDATDKPDVNDLASYDIVWLAAVNVVQRIDRHDLVPGLMLNVSEVTRMALERRARAMEHGTQDNAER